MMQMDFEIVRRVVEREGCLEALRELLHPNPGVDAHQPCHVLSSLVGQLRITSVDIVEGIEAWRTRVAGNSKRAFLWREQNYMLKMTQDLDFLAESSRQLSGLLGLADSFQWKQNPLLCNLALQHPALTCQSLQESHERWKSDIDEFLGLGGGNAHRMFHALQVLRTEMLEERHRVHWSHQQVRRDSSRVTTSNDISRVQTESPLSDEIEASASNNVKTSELQQKTELFKGEIIHAETQLQRLRQKIESLQSSLQRCKAPEKRRQIQVRVGLLLNELKVRSGDLYQRQNERKQHKKLAKRRNRLDKAKCDSNLHLVLSYDDLERLETSVLQEDELWRQHIIENVQALSTGASGRMTPKQQKRNVLTCASGIQMHAMTCEQVAEWTSSLGLASCGDLFRAHGIDGSLLVQATENDLIEIGISIRLQRLKILQEIQRRTGQSSLLVYS